ncbi:hypothetical protein FACS1894110_23350 [Spirochaetia bacterium]|nr:hypothetical protein FACS1894110_23350 [Spirochaetia bacterium]
MKSFLIKLPILSAIAVIIAQVVGRKGEPFDIKVLLLSIPFALAGYVVGWLLRWVLIHIMGATTGDWRDQLFSILFPLLAAIFGAIAAGAF